MVYVDMALPEDRCKIKDWLIVWQVETDGSNQGWCGAKLRRECIATVCIT